MKSCVNLNLPVIKESILEKGSFLTGAMNNVQLYTALQPIFSLAHKRIVGYEALLRPRDRDLNWISPAELFSQNESPSEIVRLDRLCRYIHLHNFLNINDDMNWLFLNVSPQTIISGKLYGSFFGDLLERYNFPPHRVVIEVVEYPIDGNDLLSEVINYYKSLGCLIAIDDFGAGHSNFDRIWTLQPDIVKLDRSFLVKASTRKSVRSMLSGIVSLLHQSGALVLVEGVETQDQAMIAMESDADFVQGFFFGRPFVELKSHVKEETDFGKLFDVYKHFAFLEDQKIEKVFTKYKALFAGSVEGLKAGDSLISATKELLNAPKVVRCYQIGTDGIQIGHTLVKGVEIDLKKDTIKLMYSSIYSLKRPLFWFIFILSKHFYIKNQKERPHAEKKYQTLN